MAAAWDAVIDVDSAVDVGSIPDKNIKNAGEPEAIIVLGNESDHCSHAGSKAHICDQRLLNPKCPVFGAETSYKWKFKGNLRGDDPIRASDVSMDQAGLVDPDGILGIGELQRADTLCEVNYDH